MNWRKKIRRLLVFIYFVGKEKSAPVSQHTTTLLVATCRMLRKLISSCFLARLKEKIKTLIFYKRESCCCITLSSPIRSPVIVSAVTNIIDVPDPTKHTAPYTVWRCSSVTVNSQIEPTTTNAAPITNVI